MKHYKMKLSEETNDEDMKSTKDKFYIKINHNLADAKNIDYSTVKNT